MTVKEIISYAKYGTVVVKIMEKGKMVGHGSGFFISNKYVVTNFHVASGKESYIVKTYDEQEYKVKNIVAYDESYDIAILELMTPAKNIKILRLADNLPEQGDDVLVIGAPLSLEYTVSRGIVTAIRDMPYNGTCIQIDAAISPGNSGGPVLNNECKVTGIATFYIDENKTAQNLNFAVSIDYVKYLLNMNCKKGAYDQSYKRAIKYYNEGEYDKALPLLKPYVSSKPDNADAWFTLARCYYKLKKYDESIESYKQVLRIEPNDALTYNNIANNYLIIRNYDEAMKYCNKSIELDPTGYSAPYAYYNKGNCYFDNQRYLEAIECYKKALGLKPAYTDVYIDLGLSYEYLGQKQNALESYERSIKINPKFADGYFYIGKMYFNEEKDDIASKYFIKAAEVDPGFSDPFYYLGMISLLRKDLTNSDVQSAKKCFEKAIYLDKNFSQAYTGLGRCYRYFSDFDNAVKCFTEAIKINERSKEAYYLLGITYLDLGDSQMALKCYDYLKNIDPVYAEKLYKEIYPKK